MSPSTSRPQDAFKLPPTGHYKCWICNVKDRGGQREFYGHWARTHQHVTPPAELVADVQVGGDVL